jgi:hypothetical protein
MTVYICQVLLATNPNVFADKSISFGGEGQSVCSSPILYEILYSHSDEAAARDVLLISGPGYWLSRQMPR